MFPLNINEIEVAELQRWMEGEPDGFRIIDVRETMEYAQGTIPGAQHMPLSAFAQRMSELRQDEKIVFICRSGARSGQVCAYLGNMGFGRVFNLRGGMISWVQNGLAPVLPKRSIA